MIRVLIIEDHASMRESLTAAFEQTEDIRTVGEGASAEFALALCEKLKPDVALLDVCTEGGASGLTAAEEIHEKYPQIRIVIMTAFDEISYVPRARALGADGFIYKSRSLSCFVEVIRSVYAGEKCFPQPKTIPMPQGEAPLTDREMEILRLLCKHMSSKEIADELFISENTVKYHKKNMLQKTGFSSTIDLAFYMISNGWINPMY